MAGRKLTVFRANITTDVAAVAAATANPDIWLRSAIGSTGLRPGADRLLVVADAPKKAQTGAKNQARGAGQAADRSKLDAAEKALSRLDDERKGEEGAFPKAAEDLEARRPAAQSAYVEARKGATPNVVDARTAYQKAGGSD